MAANRVGGHVHPEPEKAEREHLKRLIRARVTRSSSDGGQERMAAWPEHCANCVIAIDGRWTGVVTAAAFGV